MRAVYHLAPLLFCGITCFGAEELLTYSLKWPTGIALGKAELKVTQGARSEFQFDASLPGIPATGMFLSGFDAKGCTNDFLKRYEFGYRKSMERTVVDGTKATRQTSSGGKSTFDAGACPHDPLGFLQMLRTELAAGRKPATQKILFGAQYTLALEYPKPAGNEAGAEASDTVKVNLKGPASEHTFEIDFLRDAARTPVRVRVPLTVGKFVLELVR